MAVRRRMALSPTPTPHPPQPSLRDQKDVPLKWRTCRQNTQYIAVCHNRATSNAPQPRREPRRRRRIGAYRTATGSGLRAGGGEISPPAVDTAFAHDITPAPQGGQLEPSCCNPRPSYLSKIGGGGAAWRGGFRGTPGAGCGRKRSTHARPGGVWGGGDGSEGRMGGVQGPGMHWKGRDLRGGPRGGWTGG